MESSLDVRVSRESLDRALRIMDAVVRATERRGWTWKLQGKVTEIERGGAKLPIVIKEPCQKRLAKNQRPHWTEYDWIPTGSLTLAVDDYLKGIRSEWRDSATKPLETQLGDFLAGLDAIATHYIAREAKWAADLRASEERLQREREAKRSQAQEDAFRQDVLARVGQWTKAQEIRAYCEALASKLPTYTPAQAVTWREWIERALAEADRLDPLSVQRAE